MLQREFSGNMSLTWNENTVRKGKGRDNSPQGLFSKKPGRARRFLNRTFGSKADRKEDKDKCKSATGVASSTGSPRDANKRRTVSFTFP
jgi:hypothetical protein